MSERVKTYEYIRYMRSVAQMLDDPLFSDMKRVDMNFPGIGNGHLAREQVLPILQYLPDNIHIWEYEDVSD